jgi:cystathionine beta-lyase
MLLFCNPHNPSGRVWHRTELEQLGAVCKAHDIVVLSDEIHSDLNLWGLPHMPFALACPETSVVTMGAPSKTWGLAGLHCSFLVIPDEQLRAKYMQIAEPAHAHYGSIFATVALQSYMLPEAEEWLTSVKAYLQENVLFLEEYLSQHAPEIKIMRPEASFLVWLDMRGLFPAGTLAGEKSELAQFMRDAAVELSGGEQFGGKDCELFQRINIGCARVTLAEGLRRIAVQRKAVINNRAS